MVRNMSSPPEINKTSSCPSALPASEAAVIFRALAMSADSGVDQAVAFLEQAVARGMETREALFQLALLYGRQGNNAAGESILQKLSSIYPDDPCIGNLLGKVQWEQGQYHQALESLERAFHSVQQLHAVIKSNLEVAQKTGSVASQTRPPQQGDRQFLTRHVAKGLHHARRQRNQVIFVTERPRGREAKMAFGLRQAGWQVILLYHNEPNFDLTPFFDDHRRFRNHAEALSIAADFPGALFHVFSLMVDSTAMAFVRNKPGKIIFDPNDVFEGTINQCQEHYAGQRFCIENAHALCCRDLQIQFVKKRLHYKIPSHLIFFPEYCWDFPSKVDERKPSEQTDEIHVVSIGNFGIEKQGEGEWGYLDIARRFSTQKVHFHIYQHWFWVDATENQKNEIFADYFKLAESTPYFHLHPTVPMDRLTEEIGKYDFGINVIAALLNNVPLKKYHPAHFHNCLSLRNIDYLDAGLPVIISPQLRLQGYMLRRAGAMVEGHREFFENAIPKLRRFLSPAARAGLAKMRSVYSMRNQIKRLIQFYDIVRSAG